MTNSISSGVVIERGHISGVSAPSFVKPSFAIPIVRSHPYSNACYIQEVDAARKVVGFKHLIVGAPSVPLELPHTVELGASEVIGIVDPTGVPHAGTQEEIASIASNWLSSIDSPLTRMSFARFCKNDLVELEAATSVYHNLRAGFRDENSAISCLVYFLFTREFLSVHDSNPRSDRYNSRDAELQFEFTAGEIKIRIEAHDEIGFDVGKHDNDSRLSAIMRLLNRITGRDVLLEGSVANTLFEMSGLPEQKRGPGPAEVEMSVERSNRQEQRLAILLRKLILNPASGRKLAENHRDRAKFVNRVLPHIVHATARLETSEEVELEVARNLPSIIAASYPLQRYRLVRDLVEYLSDFPRLKAALRDFAEQSNAWEIGKHRAELLDRLS